MSDKVNFYKMTRPPRFRGIKCLKQRLADLFKGLISSIKYTIYNLLNKLRLVERYTYKDMVENYNYIPNLEYVRVGDNLINATIKMVKNTQRFFDVDYFYKGDKKLYVVKDEEEIKEFYISTLKDIRIRLNTDSKYYEVGAFPIFKVVYKNEDLVDFTRESFSDTITLDIEKLKSLRHSSLASVFSNEEDEINYFYKYACDRYREYLNQQTLSDLIVKGE